MPPEELEAPTQASSPTSAPPATPVPGDSNDPEGPVSDNTVAMESSVRQAPLSQESSVQDKVFDPDATAQIVRPRSESEQPDDGEPPVTPTEDAEPEGAEEPQAVDGSVVPKRADGVELLGEYEGSGFKDPRYLARRADGSLIQLTQLLYAVLEAIDGQRDLKEVAARASEHFGKTVSADNVATLIEKNLVPQGFVLGSDGAPVELKKKPDQLLVLRFKCTVIPERAVNILAGLLRPLFWPPVIVAVLAALVALDVWYFATHGVGQSLRDLIYQPLIVLMIYALLVLSIGWHELGHATACRYGGARPGRIGFGIYLVWPAFFTDVTDALKLGKGGRVRTDLGGIYFNAIFSLAVGGVYFLTGFEPILVLILMQHLLALYNLMPFLRLDGYHAVSDITGIPDLFGRIKPTVKGLIPWQETPEKVTELKPWARTVVTVWVLITIPVLLFMFGMMVLSVPRVIATGLDSLAIQWGKVQGAMDDGKNAQVAVGGIQSLMIVLPAAGMFFSFFRIGKRMASGFWNVTDGRPVLRTSFGAVGLAAIVAAVYVLIPNGEYKPIQPDEDWTLSDGTAALGDIGSGRPSLTEEKEEELGGAPSLSEEEGDAFVPSYERDEDDDAADSDSDTGDTGGVSEDTEDADTDDQVEEDTEATPVSSPTPEASASP